MTRHNQLTKTVLLAGLLAVLAFAGCSHTRADGQIAGDVQNKINSDPAIQEKTISASSNNGVVTLSGSVSNDFERTAAGNDAAQVDGVKTVLNDIEVRSAATPEPVRNAPARAAQSRPRRTTPSSHAASVATITIPEGTELSVRLI